MASFDIYDMEMDEPDSITEMYVLKRYFNLKAGVFKTFGEGIRKVLLEIERLLKIYGNTKFLNYCQARLKIDFAILRALDIEISEEAIHDSMLFSDLETSFESYEDLDIDARFVKSFARRLENARKAFMEQVEKTDLIQEKYYKKAFEVEKAEIKREIAEKEEEIKKYTEKCQRLQEKLDKASEEYEKEFNKLKVVEKTLKSESERYTKQKNRVDYKRADYVQKQFKKFTRGVAIKQEETGSLDFGRVGAMKLITRHMPQETIVVKEMERYKGTPNKNELLKQMKTELEEERRKQASVDDDSNTAEEAIPGTSQTPPERTKFAGKRFHISKDFKKWKSNQISLHRGKHVKIIMPPNAEGFAFGEKKGAFGRKKKGYFPISHVTPPD